MFVKSKKGISPLIATILIIVIAVVLISVVVSWGKGFSLNNLALTSKTSEKSSISNFVWQDNLLATNLFIKNTSSQYDAVIIGYKINSFLDYPFLNVDRNLTSDVVLAKNGFATIPLVCVPESKFSVDLITSTGDYVNVPVVAKNYDPSNCTFKIDISSPIDNYLARGNISVSFLSDITNSSGFETCQWTSNKDGVLSTDCDFNISSLSVNTHVITLQVTDLNSTVEKTTSIIVNPPLGLNITAPSGDAGFLDGSQVEFISSVDSNYGAYTCSWDSNIDDFLSSSCDFNISSLSIGMHLITLSVTDDLGTVTTTKNVTVKNCFTPSITSPTNSSVFVVDDTVNFNGSAINPFGSYTCSWDSNIDGSLGTGCNINISDLNIGTHLITLSITDSLETQTITSEIIIKDHLVPTILTPVASSTSNEGNTVTFSASASNTSGSYTCSWDSNIDGSLGSGCDINISDLNLGTHLITLSITDDLETVSVSQVNSVIVIVYVDDLTSLSFSDTITGYSFSGSTYNYNSLLVLNSSNTVTVTPTGTGTITVNGSTVSSGSASPAIDLSDGTEKTITVEVSDVDKYSRTYTLHLTKIVTTGGTITNGAGYRIHRFTSNGTFNSNVPLTVQLLVVGGGGGGGPYGGSGGDAGSYVYNSSYNLTTGNKTVTIGSGGYTTNGWPRVRITGTDSAFGSVTAAGGITGVEGYAYRYGGANGLGVAGQSAAAGGAGAPAITNTITGSSVAYAAGGQGGNYSQSGSPNTGTGGSGGVDLTYTHGGSGVVIVRINS